MTFAREFRAEPVMRFLPTKEDLGTIVEISKPDEPMYSAPYSFQRPFH